MENPKMNEPEEQDFEVLVDTVCEIMRQDKGLVISKARRHGVTAARNVIAAIWAETHTMQDTARRLRWNSHVHIYHARKRMIAMLGDEIMAPRIQMILKALQERAPWLVMRATTKEEIAQNRENLLAC